MICREIASIRRAHYPHRAHVTDDGTDGDFGFVVMDPVEGRPVPGRGSTAWMDELGQTESAAEVAPEWEDILLHIANSHFDRAPDGAGAKPP